MCVAPDVFAIRGGYRHLPVYHSSSLYKYMFERGCIVTACHRCAECLKRRRNSIGYCLEKEFERSNNCIFVTFTYDEDHLPLSRRTLFIDTNTGELSYGASGVSLDADDITDLPRQAIKKFYSRNLSRPRYFQYDMPEIDGKIHRLVYTPSLRRRDFSKFIKDSREDYRYKNKNRLDFKYWCIGEYGPKTCRPHLHCVFFNIDRSLFSNYFIQHWPYGEVVVEDVPKLYQNKKGEIVSGFIQLGKYLGKYMSKGVLECQSVKDRFAEKPRIISSLNVGNDVSSAMSDYLLMYDMVGHYNPNTLVKQDGSILSEEDFIKMSREFSSRRRYFVNGYEYSLPSVVIDKVRKAPVKFNNKVVRYETIPIFKILSQIAQTRALGLLDKAFRRSQKRDSEGLFIDDGSSFWIRQEARRKASLQSLVASDVIHYSRSFC